MESDGLVAEISKDDVEGMIFEEREESKQPEIFTQNSKKFKDGNEASKEIKSLKDLTYFKKLRTGQFFTSHLVKYKNDLYTLKAIPKKLIEEACIERYIQDEKDVVNKISHPFIMNYYRSFEDNKYYYLLGEYIHGIELWDAIRDIGTISSFLQFQVFLVQWMLSFTLPL